SRHHELWNACTCFAAFKSPLGTGHPRRGSSDKESCDKAITYRETAERQGSNRADGNACRKPSGRSLVDLRFHQSGPIGIRKRIHSIRETPCREGPQSVRAAARARAALRHASIEDR